MRILGGSYKLNLILYTEQYKQLIENYKLTEEQLRFTCTPKESIERSMKEEDRYNILVIEDKQLVTFFVLHRNEGVVPYSDNSYAILLRGFSTDDRHQGKGYAKKTLQLLPQLVKSEFPEINEIVLSVNVENIVAQSLYKKCGFVDEGVRVMGEKGELIVLSFYL